MATLFTRERWALTLHAGVSLLAPHAKFDAIHVYLGGDRPGESLVLDHGWEISKSGKLVLLARADDPQRPAAGRSSTPNP